jgi:hypothetical protein
MSQMEAMNMDDFMFQNNDNAEKGFNTDTKPSEGNLHPLNFEDDQDNFKMANSDPFL